MVGGGGGGDGGGGGGGGEGGGGGGGGGGKGGGREGEGEREGERERERERERENGGTDRQSGGFLDRSSYWCLFVQSARPHKELQHSNLLTKQDTNYTGR